MNRSKLKNRLVFKTLVEKKVLDQAGLKHRRDNNYIPPDSGTSAENDFGDIFNVDEELNGIESSSNLYNEVFQEKKEDNK